ncbi:hypothetical protein CLU79DRAFT_756833 [Phycomyces nitens]|nr:hypothetical protein CLU79DRAFT_756833 [Phycomyces nitens]
MTTMTMKKKKKKKIARKKRQVSRSLCSQSLCSKPPCLQLTVKTKMMNRTTCVLLAGQTHPSSRLSNYSPTPQIQGVQTVLLNSPPLLTIGKGLLQMLMIFAACLPLLGLHLLPIAAKAQVAMETKMPRKSLYITMPSRPIA